MKYLQLLMTLFLITLNFLTADAFRKWTVDFTCSLQLNFSLISEISTLLIILQFL